MALLDEHRVVTQAMGFSAYKAHFEADISDWDSKLSIVSEILEQWVAVQRNWMYLQPIFDSADINRQLPGEGKKFSNVNKQWRSTMTQVSLFISDFFASFHSVFFSSTSGQIEQQRHQLLR